MARHLHPARRHRRERQEGSGLALSDFLRREGQAADEHPRAGHRVAGQAHHRRYLHRQRQGPLESGVEQSQAAVPERSGKSGTRGRQDRSRCLHASARRSRRMEHDAQERQVGADVSQRALPDRRHRMGFLLDLRRQGHARSGRGFGAAGGRGGRCRPGRVELSHHRRSMARAVARPHSRASQCADFVEGAGRRHHRRPDASSDSMQISRNGTTVSIPTARWRRRRGARSARSTPTPTSSCSGRISRRRRRERSRRTATRSRLQRPSNNALWATSHSRSTTGPTRR